MRSVGDEELAPRLVERERVRAGAEHIRRLQARPNGFHHSIRPRIEHAERVAGSVGNAHPPFIRRNRERRGVQADHHFTSGRAVRQGDHRHRTLAGDVSHGIHAYQRPVSGRAGETVRRRPTPAPVAHVSLAPGEHDIVGRHSDIPRGQHLAARGIHFQKLIGEITTNIKPSAIRRDAQAGGDFRFAPRSLGEWQGKRGQARDQPRLADGENLDAAVHVGEVKSRAIRRKRQPGVADLPALVRLQNARRHRLRRRVRARFRGERHPLANVAGDRVQHDQFRCSSRSDQQPAVGTERQHLWPHAGQRHLAARRRNDLVDRREPAIRPQPSHRPVRRLDRLR